MAEKTSYKVGEAPWEKGAPKESFKVGEAPWEAGEPGVAAMGVPDGPTPAAANKWTPPEMPGGNNQDYADQSLAALKGGAQGLLMGHLPQAQAALEMAHLKSKDLLTGGDDYDKTSYVNERDKSIKDFEETRKKHPWNTGAGEVAGSMASLLLPGGAATKGMSTAAKIAAGMGGGALLTGLSNPGDKPGEVNPLQLSERLENAQTGGIIGGTIPIAGEMAATIAPHLKSLAERQAFKQIGPYARDAIKAFGKGVVNRIGRTLLDENVVGGLPTNYGGLASRAADAVDRKGAELGDYLAELGDAEKRLYSKVNMAPEAPPAVSPGGALEMPQVQPGQQQKGLVPQDRDLIPLDKKLVDEDPLNPERFVGSGGEGVGQIAPQPRIGVDRKAIARSMREELISADTDVPGTVKRNAQMKKLIGEFENGGDDMIPILEAEMKKRATNSTINWNRLPDADIPVPEQVNRSLSSKLRSSVENAAEFLDKTVNGPSADRFVSLKNSYGDLETASKIAGNKEARTFANRLLSPSDYGGAVLGAGIGAAAGDDPTSRFKNALIGLGAGLAHKGVRQYGYQLTAPLLDKASKVLPKLPLNNPWSMGPVKQLLLLKGDPNGQENN